MIDEVVQRELGQLAPRPVKLVSLMNNVTQTATPLLYVLLQAFRIHVLDSCLCFACVYGFLSRHEFLFLHCLVEGVELFTWTACFICFSTSSSQGFSDERVLRAAFRVRVDDASCSQRCNVLSRVDEDVVEIVAIVRLVCSLCEKSLQILDARLLLVSVVEDGVVQFQLLFLPYERLLDVSDVLVHDLPEELVVLQVSHVGEEISLAHCIVAVHVEEIESKVL